MQPVQPQKRSRRAHAAPTVPETPPQVKRRKQKRKIGNMVALLALLALVLILVVVSPKDPVKHAYYTIGTDDNLVQGAGTTGDEYAGLVISEVMTSNKTAMPDENGNYPDWIEIWNSSDHDIEMENVGLSDDELSIAFLFPKMTLAAGERIIVLCDKTNQADANKPLHAKFGLSSNGETIVLYDRNAYMIDSVTTPIMSADESYARLEDSTWGRTTEFSPGYANTTEGHQTYRSATMVTEGALIISEVCPDPLTGYRDENGELCDWIELYNTTDKPVSLDNYALSNKDNKPLKWRFPTGAYVAPYGYYIVYCTGEDVVNSDPTAVPHANFRISAEHDTVILSDSRGRLVDRVTIDNIPEDASYARDEGGLFTVHLRPTPQLPNNDTGANQMDVYLRALNGTGVYITEVMASNDTTETTVGSDYVDWIELYNSSSSTVNLSGYGLSDNLGRARKWQFPEGTYINPGEYKIIWCDGDTTKNTASEPHTSFKLVKGGGETLVFADPTGRILDKVVLPAVPTNVSYGRTAGREGFFYYDTPTPGTLNGGGFLGYAAAPELTTAPGMHNQGVKVGFTLVEDAAVYYTTDGSIPTKSNGILYTGQEIELIYTTTLRACAYPYSTQYKESEVTTGTYLINKYHEMPVVCLTVDPEELWNETDGMLAEGPNIKRFDEEGNRIFPFENSIYREFGKIPREGYAEYYTEDGEQLFSQGVAIGLIGDYSLDMPQKSFKIRAKSLYGEKVFAASVFEDREFTEYKSLVLRNSGNDCAWTRLLDGFQSRLVDSYQAIKLAEDESGEYAEHQVIHQAWMPVAVYLNGTYWGHYNLRERVDRFFVAQHEGLSLDEASNMDILVGDGSVEYGSNKEYKAMLKKIKAGDPANNAEDLKYIEDNIDLDNFLEYMALEMFIGNSDIGNIRYYRLHGTDPETGEPYKWKWILYDMDYGLYSYSFNSPYSYTKEKGMGQMNIDNTIFKKVLSVPKYKELFLQKLGDIFQTFTTEYMSAMLDTCVAEIEPEMKMHFARWAEQHDKWVLSEWPTTIDGAYRYWERRVNRLYNTLKIRPNYLWDFVQDEFKLTDEEMERYFGPQPELPDDAVL
ncbi:MAG: lamin tail domain-containing protein [Clostridia bacterium]|nr:lamin tail domain-containing protein [Clostridia bacterium]